MEHQGLYHDIVETSADGIWVFDLEGRTRYANPAIAAMFGTTREEFLASTVFDTLDEAGKVQFREHLADLREGRVNPHDVEVSFVRRDGTSFWALVSEALLTGDDGTPRVLHRFADFDDWRRVVDELTESRRQLTEGQRIARIGTWEWDVAADRIEGSEGLVELYSLRPGYLPTTYATVLESVHPFDLPRVEEAVERALAGEDEFLFEARIFAAGEWIWTRGRGEVHRHGDGSVRTVTGTFQDVTETKRVEVALQDQVAQNTLMQAVATAANEASTLRDVLVHARHMVLLHDDWERARAFLVTADGADVEPLYFLEGDQEADAETPEASAMELELARRCLREGTSVWDDQMLTIAFAVRDGGRAVAVLTITSAPPLARYELIESMVDAVSVQLGRVVERERAERALAQARDAAMEASRKKSEFLATMSHEIRTPLNGVIGLNDLLMRTRLDADQRRLASGVQAASRTLLGLINDILDFSKIEAGKLTLERVDFEVRAVLDQVTNVLGESARAKGLDLLVVCDDTVPAVLAGDPTRLTQVVTNLGSNAVKFTDGGEVVVRASARERDGLTELRVEVTDTGIGIGADHVEELFESFTQADASTTRVHGGTGLGLAISREIVHALGGEIGVDSAAGRGSTFWFTALLHPAAHGDTPDDFARQHLAGRRALVVDDERNHREVLAEQMSWWGLRCSAVASAEEAEQALAGALASGDPYDVVLVDRTLSMPRRNGLHLARELRARPVHDDTVLMLLSATTDLDTAAVREHGVADCLIRPVSVQGLRHALLRHVADVETPEKEVVAAPPTSASRGRVLVVEDNAVNQMVAVGLLDALGWAADTADDGQAALEAFDPEKYDVVLMDVQMPRLDGYAATRAIRERGGRRVPIVAMTAAAVEGERERCLAAGMDDFITKPVNPAALATALDRWTGSEPTPEPGAEPQGLDRGRLDMLRDLAPGSTAYLDRAIGNFDQNADGQLGAVRRALAAGDLDALAATAHALAGSAGNLGVAEVADLARRIELAARGGSTEGVDVLAEELRDAVERGRASLRAYRAAYADA